MSGAEINFLRRGCQDAAGSWHCQPHSRITQGKRTLIFKLSSSDMPKINVFKVVLLSDRKNSKQIRVFLVSFSLLINEKILHYSSFFDFMMRQERIFKPELLLRRDNKTGVPCLHSPTRSRALSDARHRKRRRGDTCRAETLFKPL